MGGAVWSRPFNNGTASPVCWFEETAQADECAHFTDRVAGTLYLLFEASNTTFLIIRRIVRIVRTSQI